MILIMLAGTFSGWRARESQTGAESSFNFEGPGRPRGSQGLPGAHRASQGLLGLTGPHGPHRGSPGPIGPHEPHRAFPGFTGLSGRTRAPVGGA